jgi:phosphatidylinositol-3,4,5-trisphosphate 3-phosphatase/dual-specificity protein phosphatase PTEN
MCLGLQADLGGAAAQGKEKMFHLWFNTFFVDGYRFVAQQPEIDKVTRGPAGPARPWPGAPPGLLTQRCLPPGLQANKDKKNKVFPEGFWIEILFEAIDKADADSVPRCAEWRSLPSQEGMRNNHPR